MATGEGDESATARNGLIIKAPMKHGTNSTDPASNCVCRLDLRTQLRMAEAENAVLQQQITMLLSEKYYLEESSSSYYSNWQFALMQCGRVAEERTETLAKLSALQQSSSSSAAALAAVALPTSGKKARRSELEQLRQTLDTQTRVCEQLEQERDRANDDFQCCQAQMITLLDNYERLATASAAVARERDAAQQEVAALHQQLAQWEEARDKDYVRNSDKSRDKQLGTVDESSSDHTRDLAKELSQCKELVKKSDLHRYQAVKDKQASDSIVTLWQRKHETIANENRELKEEVLVAQERISFLQEQLAMLRLHYRTVLPVTNGNQELQIHPADNSLSSSPGGSQVFLHSSASVTDEEVSWI